MSTEQYLLMCEQMGWEPKEEELPKDLSELSLESQQAVIILQSLPDRWDGMSGSWFGKDYSGLDTILDIYDVEDRRLVFELLQIAEDELGKYYAQKQKEQKALSKRAK